MNIGSFYKKREQKQLRASGHDEIIRLLAQLKTDNRKIDTIEYDQNHNAVMVITLLNEYE